MPHPDGFVRPGASRKNARAAEVALTGNRVRRLLLDGADLEVFGGTAAARGWDKNAANEMGNTRKDT